jgi:3-hydroxyacyl-CoA dehydrogenase
LRQRRAGCHLLDIVPNKLTPDEEKKRLTLDHPAVRNRIVNAGLEAIKKSKPAALFTPQTVDRIAVGNLEDDFDLVRKADWIIEAVVENLEIKRALMARLDAVRKPDAIVTTNTSGIPISAIAANSSEAFRQHFLGAHFFNPPRYLKLLEVIPSKATLPKVVETIKCFGEQVLGKGVVICKDRPNFVANRLGTFIGLFGLRYALEHGYAFNEVDDITGPLIGHPKTASFRLLDLVGIDVMLHVAENSSAELIDDESREEWKPLEFLREMVKRGWLGNKTGQGIYKQVKTDQGREFHVLDPKTFEYKPQEKANYDSVIQAEMIEDLNERLRFLVALNDRAGKFIWDNTALPCLHVASSSRDCGGHRFDRQRDQVGLCERTGSIRDVGCAWCCGNSRAHGKGRIQGCRMGKGDACDRASKFLQRWGVL